LPFNFSVGYEKQQRLASSYGNGEAIDRLKGTFPHVISKAREVGRALRSRVPAFATKTLGRSVSSAVEILGNKMPGVVLVSGSAEATAAATDALLYS
jgi:hypothetical protein